MKVFTAKNEVENYTSTRYWNSLPEIVPSVVFQTRVEVDGNWNWQSLTTYDIFADKKVLIFSLPGAFTPTCSTFQLPTFEALAPKFYEKGFSDIYCVSVNDSFVMNKWAASLDVQNIKMIPDGNAKFTENMNMIVDKENLGFGRRSWRYAAVVENGTITSWFIEEGREDNCEEDPYMYTNPSYILENV